MPFCGRATWWAKAAFVLLFPAIAIHCAGIGTPYWMKTSMTSNKINITFGLWKMVNCSGNLSDPCVGSELPSSYRTDLLTATRGLECSVLIPLTLALTLSFFYVASPGARTQMVAAWVMLLSFFCFALIIAGTITWLQNIPNNHYVFWSMGLTVFAGSICMIVGVLMIPDVRKFDYEGARMKEEARRERREARRHLKETY